MRPPQLMDPHHILTDDIRDLAALYALGAMPADEAKNYASHLEQCAVCLAEVEAFEPVATAIAEAHATSPPAALRHRLFDGIESTPAKPASAPPLVDVILRGENLEWTPVPFATGVYRRTLFVHPATGDETLLVRMDPGGKYPAHPHVGVEQMYILSGELIFDDHTLHAGDFEAATAGHAHAAATTNSGCVVLVVHRPLTHA